MNRRGDADTVVATDVGQHQMWTMQFYKFEKPQKLLTSGGLGTMGYGLGSCHRRLHRQRKKADGAFYRGWKLWDEFNEMATAVSQNLPLTIVVMNNDVLGMVRQWQTIFYDCHYSHTTLDRRTDSRPWQQPSGQKGFLPIPWRN